MKIYIQSAGTRIDYYWLNKPQNSDIIKWHLLLGEQDKVFALVAGYSEGSWHIELRNLLLPGVTDEIASRQIVFNICFSELKSEEEVRALALAYLDSELKRKKSERPIARCIPELAAAYKAMESGAYDYTPEIAIEWAKKAIAEGKKVLKSAPESKHKLHCTINPKNEDEVKRLRKYMEATALTQQNGLRLIWSDTPKSKEVLADVILSYTKNTGSWEVSIPPTPSIKIKLQRAIALAKELLPPPLVTKPNKTVLAIMGIGIFALILGLLAAVLCLPDKKKEDSKPQTPSKIETGIVAPPHDIPSTKGEQPTAPDKPAPAEPAPAEPAPAEPAPAEPAPAEPAPAEPAPAEPAPAVPAAAIPAT